VFVVPQIGVLETVAEGTGFIVTTVVDVEAHPPFVTECVTVYVPGIL